MPRLRNMAVDQVPAACTRSIVTACPRVTTLSKFHRTDAPRGIVAVNVTGEIAVVAAYSNRESMKPGLSGMVVCAGAPKCRETSRTTGTSPGSSSTTSLP